MVLLVGLGGVLYLSYRWVKSLGDGLSLKREMRFGWSQVGDHIQERFTLVNEGWAPALWIGVIDHSDMPGYQTSTITGVGMMVMPPIVSLPSIDVAPGGRFGEGHIIVRSLFQTINAASVREYNPGDSLRVIHWPTTARRDHLHVRTFDSTPSSDWWIYLDLNSEVQVGEAESATIEHAIILAASLADRGLRAGRAVGLVAEGQDLIWLPPQLEEDQRWEILHSLALVEPGERSLGELMDRTQSSLRQRSSLIIISPDLGGDWLDAMSVLMNRGIIPTVLLLDAAAFGGQGDITAIEAVLTDLGVIHYRITPDLLDQPSPQELERYQWRVTPHGRAMPVIDTRELGWRTLK